MNINDDMLVAYLDAELDDADYLHVEAALAASQGLQNRLQALVESAEQVRNAYRIKLEEPVPANLVAAILNAPWPANRRPKQISWWKKLSQLSPFAGLTQAWPMAAFASVAMLTIGIWVGQTTVLTDTALSVALRQGANIEDARITAALELAPSTRILQSSSGKLQVLASFTSGHGAACREFEMQRSDPDRVNTDLGIACRASDGNWNLVFLASEQVPTEADAAIYRSASDVLHQAVDGYLAKSQGLKVLSESEEQQWLRSGWTER